MKESELFSCKLAVTQGLPSTEGGRNLKRLQETDAERLVQALDQEIRSRGRGSICAMERAVGHSEGWWKHRAESGNITAHQLLTVLDHLGLDPVGFLRRALGAEGGLELDRPHGKPPEIVVKAWARVRSGDEGTGLGATFLDTLDKQRYQEPEEVVRLALWAVDHIELELLPHLLGVVGSAWRLMILLDEAEYAIYAGIEIALQQADQPTVGNLLRRLSYVFANRGDREEALRLAERATIINLRHGDCDAVGRSLVAQGIWLYYLDRPEEAIATLKTALDHLSAGPSRNRFAAFQCMGFAHQRLGYLSTALENVEAAEETMPKGDEGARGKLLWLRGRIYVDLGKLEQAALALAEVITIFQGLHHGETALATCELVRILLAQERPEDAYETAMAMRALLEPLRHNKIISAALGDLLRCGHTSLTLTLVKRAMAQIEDERQKGQTWRLLRIRPPGA
jgi:tetratricopeptide (TPR) repeat protein